MFQILYQSLQCHILTSQVQKQHQASYLFSQTLIILLMLRISLFWADHESVITCFFFKAQYVGVLFNAQYVSHP